MKLCKTDTLFAAVLSIMLFMLVLPSLSSAAVVYTGSAPVTVSLDPGTASSFGTVHVDGNSNGGDWDHIFVSLLPGTGPTGTPSGVLKAEAMGSVFFMNLAPGGFTFGAELANLNLGDPIGPPAFAPPDFGFLTIADMASPPSALGAFNPGSPDGYLGLQSATGHLGWMSVSVSDFGLPTMTATFGDWAYESDLGVPIAAGAVPEPSTMLLTGIGAAMIARFRRRKIV